MLLIDPQLPLPLIKQQLLLPCQSGVVPLVPSTTRTQTLPVKCVDNQTQIQQAIQQVVAPLLVCSFMFWNAKMGFTM